MLGILDADDLEAVLLCRQRAKRRERKVLFGSSKFRQKVPATPDKDHHKGQSRRPIQIIRALRDSESDQESSSSGSEGDLRRAYAAVATPFTGKGQNGEGPRSHKDLDSDQGRRVLESLSLRDSSGSPKVKSTHCSSKKHGDLDCWKRLGCERCGKRGHPSDRCLFVCRGCNEVHDFGKCHMEKKLQFNSPVVQPHQACEAIGRRS